MEEDIRGLSLKKENIQSKVEDDMWVVNVCHNP
jgi:hypothetical protein